MLKSNEMKTRIFDLFAEEENKPIVTGSGVVTARRIGFDQFKIDSSKAEFASYLTEIGADKHPLVSLASLTTTEDGEVWNELQTIEDFQALDLFIACINACGFVVNNSEVMKRNIAQIGSINSILISNIGRDLVGNDEEYLKRIRECVANNMFFVTNMELIQKLAPAKETVTSLK